MKGFKSNSIASYYADLYELPERKIDHQSTADVYAEMRKDEKPNNPSKTVNLREKYSFISKDLLDSMSDKDLKELDNWYTENHPEILELWQQKTNYTTEEIIDHLRPKKEIKKSRFKKFVNFMSKFLVIFALGPIIYLFYLKYKKRKDKR